MRTFQIPEEENHDLIFLQPDPGNPHADRLWCEDKIDHDWQPYVRSDLVKELLMKCVNNPTGVIPDRVQDMLKKLEALKPIND